MRRGGEGTRTAGAEPAADAEVGMRGGLAHGSVRHRVLGGAGGLQVGHDGWASFQPWREASSGPGDSAGASPALPASPDRTAVGAGRDPYSHSSLRVWAQVGGRSRRKPGSVLRPAWSSCTPGGHISPAAPGWGPHKNTLALGLQGRGGSAVHPAQWPSRPGGSPGTPSTRRSYRAGTSGLCRREP